MVFKLIYWLYLKERNNAATFYDYLTFINNNPNYPRINRLKYIADNKINLISFCMGEIGKHSRILCLYLGSPFTYVSLGKPIAPGQFSLDEVKLIFGKKKNR